MLAVLTDALDPHVAPGAKIVASATLAVVQVAMEKQQSHRGETLAAMAAGERSDTVVVTHVDHELVHVGHCLVAQRASDPSGTNFIVSTGASKAVTSPTGPGCCP